MNLDIMNIAWISKIEWGVPHLTSRIKLSEALRKRGHNVNLYLVKKFGEKDPSPNNVIFIPTIHLPILSGIFYGLIVFLYFPILLKKKNVDVIIIDCTKVWLPFVIPLKILNIPIVLDIRTLPIDRDESFTFKVSMYLSRYVIDGITTITPDLKNILLDVYNIRNIKIGVWFSGVSINDFDNVSLNKNNFTHIDLKNRKFTLLYHGDYSPTRGIENLIIAISKLKNSIKNDIRLLIIGMPKEKIKNLYKISEDEGVKEQITILSTLNYRIIAQYLKIADIGIIPLPPKNKWWKVSAPLKTLEYLASGTPVIATNIPFHRRIFEKGNCGILLKDATPESIARGITYLYKNQTALKKMGKNGRKIVEEFYTWDTMAKKVEDFLKNIRVNYS